MPIYTLETGDGRRLKIEADTPDAATAEANAWSAANPIQQKEGFISEVAGNIGPSAVEYGKALVEPFLSPIETAKAVGEIGSGLYSKAAGALGAKQDPQMKAQKEAVVNALGDFYGERYGSWSKIENTARKDPVGLAGDLSAIFTLGGGAAARLPGMAGKAGQIAATAGQAIDPLNVAAKAASGTAGLLGKTTAELTGLSAGTGSLPIEQAYRAGVAGDTGFTTAMRGAGEAEDALRLVDSSVDQIVSKQRSDYLSDINALKNDKQTLDSNPVMKALEDTKEIFASKSGSIINEGAASTYNALKGKLEEFLTNPQMKNTPIEFDEMKQAIGEITNGVEKGTKASVVADRVYKAIVKEITDKAPTYAKTMQDYSEVKKLVTEIRKTFSLGGNPDTAVRKLQSVMRNNVNTNYGQRQKLIDVLAQYEPSLPNVIAGQALSSWTPRGLAGQATRLQGAAAGLLGAGGAISPGAALLAVPALAASSPRVLGETAYGAGRVAAGLNAIPSIPRPALAGSVQVGRARQELERLAQESAGLLGQ
jgi:hypothetical protein